MTRKRVHRIWRPESHGLPYRQLTGRNVGPVIEIAYEAEFPNHAQNVILLRSGPSVGRRLRILTILARYTRECLPVRVQLSIPYP